MCPYWGDFSTGRAGKGQQSAGSDFCCCLYPFPTEEVHMRVHVYMPVKGILILWLYHFLPFPCPNTTYC